MEQIAKKVTVEGTVIVDLSSTTLSAAEAKAGRWFYNADGHLTQGTYTPPTVQIDTNNEFTAGTSQIIQNADTGKYFSSVIINPTPTEKIEITPTTEVQIINSEGKYLSEVTVKAIETEEKEIVPTTAAANVQPTTGYFLSKVTVKPLQTKTINNFLNNQIVTADEGYCGLYSVSIAGAQKEFDAINAIIGEGI